MPFRVSGVRQSLQSTKVLLKARVPVSAREVNAELPLVNVFDYISEALVLDVSGSSLVDYFWFILFGHPYAHNLSIRYAVKYC